MRHQRTITTLVATTALVGVLAVAGGSATASGATSSASAAAKARPAGQQAGRPAPGPKWVPAAAKYLGMKAPALMKQLKANKTLTSIATAKGKSVDGLKAAIIADAETHLAADVASGKHTQAEADERLAQLKTSIDDIVTKPLPARGPGGDCPNGGGPGGAGGAGAPGAGPGAGTGATTGTGGGTYL